MKQKIVKDEACETNEQKAFRYLQRCVDEYVVDLKSKKIIGDIHMHELASIVGMAIAEEREANGWRDIESAPKDGTCILALVPDSDVANVLAWCDEPKGNPHKDNLGVGWRMVWDSKFFRNYEQPALWMPHPAAPKDEVSE